MSGPSVPAQQGTQLLSRALPFPALRFPRREHADQDQQRLRLIVHRESQTPEWAQRDSGAALSVAMLALVGDHPFNRRPKRETIRQPPAHMLVFEDQMLCLEKLSIKRGLTDHRQERL